jgi:hypothetical protein
VFDGKLGDVGQRLQLRRLGVTVKRAGGGQRQLFIMDAEAGQVAAAEVFGQRVRSGARIEMPVGQVLGDGAMLRHAAAQRIGQQQFRRAQALEVCGQGVERGFQQAQVAVGEVEPGQAGALAVDGQCQQQAVVALVEQVGVGQRAGRDDARHGAFHRAFTQRRVADLFADCHRDAELDQLRQVAVDGVVGNAGHGDRLAGGLAARGQRDVEQARGLLGIFKEQFVEISHAEEQQLVGVLCLGAQPLLHYGGVRRQFGGRQYGRHRTRVRP